MLKLFDKLVPRNSSEEESYTKNAKEDLQILLTDCNDDQEKIAQLEYALNFMVNKHKKMNRGSDRWKRHGLKMILYSDTLGNLQQVNTQTEAEVDSLSKRIKDKISTETENTDREKSPIPA